jgi:hypothetical protein
MLEEHSVEKWFRDAFLLRYPSPPRAPAMVSASEAAASGFDLVGEESFTDDIVMSMEEFVDYELSTTNIMAAIGGPAGAQTADAWLRATLALAMNGRPRGTFHFQGRIVFLKKR